MRQQLKEASAVIFFVRSCDDTRQVLHFTDSSSSVFECEKKKNRDALSPNAERIRRVTVGAEEFQCCLGSDFQSESPCKGAHGFKSQWS